MPIEASFNLGSSGKGGIRILGFGGEMRGGEPELELSTVRVREMVGRRERVI